MKQLMIISVLLIVFNGNGFSQKDTSEGINFDNRTSWEEVLQLARQQHKYIFIDCYASWCGPCKWMDKNVYDNDTVGKYMADKYISVKIQLDSTQKDADPVRQWYGVAHYILQQYHITSFPTFLFLAPDGQVVHRAVGARKVNDFIALATSALDPEQQFYSQVKRYQGGDQNITLVTNLTETARKIGEDSLGRAIANGYIHRYLPLLPDTALFTKENIEFIVKNSDSLKSDDVLFRRFMSHRKQINLIMAKDGYADGLINKLVERDEVAPTVEIWLKDSTLINWRELGQRIARDYGHEYVKHNLILGQLNFYNAKGDGQKYASALVEQRDEVPIRSLPVNGVTALFLNNDAYLVFKYSDKKKELKAALKWVELSMSMQQTPDPEVMDTKANLLYKLGKKKEGIVLEAQSHQLEPKNLEIAANYDKMKSGLPTWN